MAGDKAPLLQRLAHLRQDYLHRLPGELEAIAHLARQVDASPAEAALLKTLHLKLHSLVGSSGTFGLMALSSEARRLEQQVKAWTHAGQAGPAADRQSLGQAVLALPRFLAETAPAPGPSPATASTPAADAPVCLIGADADTASRLPGQLAAFGYRVQPLTTTGTGPTPAPGLALLCLPDTPADEALLRTWMAGLTCPLLALSNRSDFDQRALASRLGALDFFPQPLELPRLVNRMTQLGALQRAPRRRVLIVEDDPALASHYCLTLQAADLDADVLTQPRELLQKLATFQPELVLMDLYMPGHSGPELAGIIRQHDRWASLPVVYLSAETSLSLQEEALRRGADDFLTKPIADARLVAIVRARIDRARQLDCLISKDSLTGLLKHAAIKDAARNESKRAARTGRPLTLAMLDIDHFKQVNDRYGHATGDLVIGALGTLLQQCLRQTDLIGRYGGEEFLVVLPDCPTAEAEHRLDDIRQRFAQVGFRHQDSAFTCTLSCGLASLTANGTDLLAAADAALYQAKQAGRNRLCTATA